MRTSVRRRLALLLAALALAVGWLPLTPGVAHAASDLVRHLDTTYAIQADGTVRVRQQIDWRFGESGRHGIQLKLVTRERWSGDRSQDVVYRITDVAVSSPTGAPAQFTQTTEGSGSNERLALRIGDPERTVDSADQTYVLTYTLSGALRTFDGEPELHWDVTSTDFPAIERFTVRVTAPGGVPRARCLVGSRECDQAIVDGAAVLTGADVATGATITAVAGLNSGSVRNARPSLEPRRVTSPTMTSLDSTATLGRDGVLRVDQQMQYRFPDGKASSLEWLLPSRRPYTETEDVILVLTDVRVTADGRRAAVRDRPYVLNGKRSRQFRELRADIETAASAPGAARPVALTYAVSGAAVRTGDHVVLEWPMVGADLPDEGPASITLDLPAAPWYVECVGVDPWQGQDMSCGRTATPTTEGTRVRLVLPEGTSAGISDRWTLRVGLPPDAVDDPALTLEPSIDRAQRIARDTALGITGGGFAALAGLGWVIGHGRRGRDRRFADTPPGIVNDEGSPTEAAEGRREIPVRFTPPDGLTPAQAGVLLDRRYRPAHLAASIVALAVGGFATVGTRPLSIRRTDRRPAGDRLSSRLWKHADPPETPAGTKLSGEAVGRMVAAARSAADRTRADESLALPGEWILASADDRGRSRAKRKRRRGRPTGGRRAAPRWAAEGEAGGGRPRPWWVWPALVVGVFVALVALNEAVLSRLLESPILFWMPLLITIGFALGLWNGRRRDPGVALAARGTALREQTIGFRTYLATAEADQLDFEADSDIFRRYLPWAVLFGLTRRWTQVCRELADAGRIPPLDADFLAGADLDDLGGALVRFSASLERAETTRAVATSARETASSLFSGGDGSSGSSSGFSGGSSGGSGGGGTSASSW